MVGEGARNYFIDIGGPTSGVRYAQVFLHFHVGLCYISYSNYDNDFMSLIKI